MREKKTKPKKQITQKQTVIFAVFLLILNFAILLSISFFQELSEEIDYAMKRFDHVCKAAEETASQTEYLTESFDSWFFRRLDYIAFICEEQDEGRYEKFVEYGREMVSGGDFYLPGKF